MKTKIGYPELVNLPFDYDSYCAGATIEWELKVDDWCCGAKLLMDIKSIKVVIEYELEEHPDVFDKDIEFDNVNIEEYITIGQTFCPESMYYDFKTKELNIKF